MLIAWLEPPSVAIQGDQVHRTLAPAEAIAQLPGEDHVVVGSRLSPTMHAAAEVADALVLCQAIDADFLPLIERRRARGQVTLFEINDHVRNEQAVGEAGAFYQSAATQALVDQLAERADGLWCSSDALRAVHGASRARAWTIGNAAPAARPLRPAGAVGTPLRVGWAGSQGHADDIADVVPAIAALLRERPEVTFCVMAPRALWPLFARLPANRTELRAAAGFDDYLHFVHSLEVSLAPLRDTPFNRARSDVKFLEAAAMGAVFVGQRAPAYDKSVVHDHNGVRFDTPDALAAQLAALCTDPARRARLAARAQADVLATRSLRAVAQQRRDALVACAPTRAATHRPDPHLAFAQLCARARREIGSALTVRNRFAWLPLAAASRDLFDGLLAHGRGQPAARALQRACQALPSFYVAPLCAGASATPSADSIAALQRAYALAPQSDAVALALTQHRLATGDLNGARASCQRRIAADSHYAALWLAYAQCLQAGGARAKAEDALRQALRLAPRLWTAREALQALLADASAQTPARWAEALTLAEAGAALCPTRAEAHLGVAHAHRGRGAWPDTLQAAGRALALGRARPDIWQTGHVLAAEACLRMGQRAAARRHLADARAPTPAASKNLRN